MRKILVPRDVQIAVLGDLHEHDKQFFNILEKIKPHEKMWVVSLGDVIDKGYGDDAFVAITDKLIELDSQGIGFAVIGNHEKKHIKKYKNNLSPQLKWWQTKPLSLTFEFYNGAMVTCLHAGVSTKMTWEDLQTNTEVLYIRDLDKEERMIQLIWKDIDGVKTLVPAKQDGKSWHLYYQGQFGFICSGHAAQYDGLAKFYNYSCNLDSAVFETGILTAQIFTSEGKLGELITVSGTPFKPKLNIGY